MQEVMPLIFAVIIIFNICVFFYHCYLNSSSVKRMNFSGARPGAEDPEILHLLSQLQEQNANHLCPYCHSELPAGAEFCSRCGRSLKPGGVKVFNGFGNDDRIDEVNRWLADNPHICDAAFEFSAVRTPGAFTHITHLTGITISYHVSASWSNKQYAIVQLQKYRAFSFFDDIDRGTDALKANWLDSNPEARFVGAAAAYSSRESGGGSSSLQVFSAVEFPRRSSPSSQKQPEIPPRQAAPIGDKQETRGQNQQPQNQQARNQQPWNQQAQNHPYQNQQIQTEQAPNQKSGGQQPEKQNTANQQTKGNHDHGETQQPKKKKGTVRFVVILIILFLLAFAAGIGYSYYMDASSCSGTSGYVSQLAGICIEQYYKFINIIKK